MISKSLLTLAIFLGVTVTAIQLTGSIGTVVSTPAEGSLLAEQAVNITARIAAVNDSIFDPIVGTVVSADKTVIRVKHTDPNLPAGTELVDIDLHIRAANGTAADITLTVDKVVNLTVAGGSAADLKLHVTKMKNGTSGQEDVNFNTWLTFDQFENNTASSATPTPARPGYCQHKYDTTWSQRDGSSGRSSACFDDCIALGASVIYKESVQMGGDYTENKALCSMTEAECGADNWLYGECKLGCKRSGGKMAKDQWNMDKCVHEAGACQFPYTDWNN